MQAAVNAIRATGATQLILVEGTCKSFYNLTQRAPLIPLTQAWTGAWSA